MKKNNYYRTISQLGAVSSIIALLIMIYKGIFIGIPKDKILYLSIIILLIVLLTIFIIILKKTVKQNSFNCPFNHDTNSKECPLGVINHIEKSKETLDSIFDTKEKYYFLGVGSENICLKLGEDDTKYNELIERNNDADNPIEFNFIIRDMSNENLIQEQQKLRYDNNRPITPVKSWLENALKYHKEFRKYGLNIWTYLSDILASFRIIIVDDKAYVSFNEIGKSSQETHQLVIKKTSNPLNLYNWFYNHVIFNQKDVIRKNKIVKSKELILKPNLRYSKDYYIDQCDFCQILKHEESHKNKIYNKIIHETKNFIVIPAKGHFVSGYLLIIPKKHVYSISEFISNRNIYNEYKNLITKVRNLIQDKFGKTIEFEHGSTYGNSFAGNTIDHAHMHILPFESSELIYSIINDYKKVERINSIEELQNIHNPYLYIHQKGKHYISEITDELEGQYLRKHVYRSLFNVDDDGWNWKTHTHQDKLEITLNAF